MDGANLFTIRKKDLAIHRGLRSQNVYNIIQATCRGRNQKPDPFENFSHAFATTNIPVIETEYEPVWFLNLISYETELMRV